MGSRRPPAPPSPPLLPALLCKLKLSLPTSGPPYPIRVPGPDPSSMAPRTADGRPVARGADSAMGRRASGPGGPPPGFDRIPLSQPSRRARATSLRGGASIILRSSPWRVGTPPRGSMARRPSWRPHTAPSWPMSASATPKPPAASIDFSWRPDSSPDAESDLDLDLDLDTDPDGGTFAES